MFTIAGGILLAFAVMAALHILGSFAQMVWAVAGFNFDKLGIALSFRWQRVSFSSYMGM